MRRADIVSGATGQWVLGGTPVEHTDTIVYNGADYHLGATPDPRYTIGAMPTDTGQYEVGWNPTPNTFVGRAYGLYESLRELNTEEEYDTLREHTHRLNGITLVSEREYAQMEREGNLDPNEMYYTYSDDGLTVTWTEKHPKKETIAYFIS